MKKYIILFSVVLMSMTGMGAVAPSPQTDPVSAYVMAEDLPTEMPVTHLLSFHSKLMIGGEDGLFIQGKDKAWQSALPFPHSVYQHLFVSGGYAYACINKSKSKFRADLWWYRSKEGTAWEACHKPALHAVIAYDGQRKILYKATKNVAYKSTLISSINENVFRFHDDKRLQKIHALKVQNRSGNLLVGTTGDVYLSKNQGESFTSLNSVLRIPAYKGGHKYQFFVNDDYMLVQLDSYRLFLSKDGGEHFEELTVKGLLKHPKGKWGLRQICSLNGSRIIVRKNSDYYVMDLATGSETNITLPRYYQYSTFVIHYNQLFAATKSPFQEMFKNVTGKSRKRVAPLLRLSLNSMPLCRTLLGNQKPKMIRGHLNSQPLVDNDSLYMHEKQFLWNLTSTKKVSDKRMVLRHLTKGSKGHWYSISASTQSSSGTRFQMHTLLRSKDKGKSWLDTGTRLGLRHNTVFDDSLEIAYTSIGRALLRKDWKSNEATQHYFTKEEGEIVKLHIDADSRLWVLTTKGLFMSVPDGWDGIPLPFKLHGEIPLTNFALIQHRMVINYNGRIYMSPIDEVKWEQHTICDPCDDDSEMRFRMVGHSDELLVLQEQEYGHIWILKPTHEKERFYFPRENGLIRKVHVRANKQLLIETTGVPIVPNGDRNTSRLMKPAPLFSYTIHLKTTDHGSK